MHSQSSSFDDLNYTDRGDARLISNFRLVSPLISFYFHHFPRCHSGMCHHSVCPLKFINNAVVILRVINHTGYLPLPLHHVTLTIGGGHFIPFDPLLSVAYLLLCFVQHRFRFFFYQPYQQFIFVIASAGSDAMVTCPLHWEKKSDPDFKNDYFIIFRIKVDASVQIY